MNYIFCDFCPVSFLNYLNIFSRLAKSIFQKKSCNMTFQPVIKEIKYVENSILLNRYTKCKETFKSNGVTTTERLVFHGTQAPVHEIFENGFLLSKVKKMAYGYGIYFSEHVLKSLSYGDNLILNRVLIGKSYTGPEKCVPHGYNSKIEGQDKDGNSTIFLFDNEDQILPCFQIVLSPETLEESRKMVNKLRQDIIAKTINKNLPSRFGFGSYGFPIPPIPAPPAINLRNPAVNLRNVATGNTVTSSSSLPQLSQCVAQRARVLCDRIARDISGDIRNLRNNRDHTNSRQRGCGSAHCISKASNDCQVGFIFNSQIQIFYA